MFVSIKWQCFFLKLSYSGGIQISKTDNCYSNIARQYYEVDNWQKHDYEVFSKEKSRGLNDSYSQSDFIAQTASHDSQYQP